MNPRRLVPFVTVIVPVRNEEGTIGACLESLVKQDYPSGCFEILVVDNGSIDRTPEILHRFPVRVVREPVPGAARARNRGACEAAGEILAFIDADCTAASNWLSALIGALEREPSAAFAGADVVSGRKSVLAGYLNWRGFGFFREDTGCPADPSGVPWLMTGNLAVRREPFESVGGFDASLLPGEDIDFSWRMLLLGWYPVFVPDAAVTENRPYDVRSFCRKNFRTGRVSLILQRRFRDLWSEWGIVPAGRCRDRGFAGKLVSRLKSVFPGMADLLSSRRWAYLFLLVMSHLCFRFGRLAQRFSRVPDTTAVPAGSTRFFPHPLLRCLPLQPEEKLVYLCAVWRGQGGGDQAVRRLLAGITDWDRLLQGCARHKLQPRFFALLKRCGAQAFLPPDLWRKIESFCVESQVYTCAVDSELTWLLPAFHQAGVEPMLLKGAALQQTVYRGEPGRFYVDLDLMVRGIGRREMVALMDRLGYRPMPVRSPLPSRWHEQALRFEEGEVSFPFIHQERGIHVDLHVEPFADRSPVRLPAGWIWQEARSAEVAQSQAFLPEPTRLFTHILFHLAKHAAGGEHRLGWYLDLDETARFYEGQLDGPLCARIIRTADHPRMLARVLLFLKSHFGTPLPPEVEGMIPVFQPEPFSLRDLFYSPRRPDIAGFLRPDWTDRRETFMVYVREIPRWPAKILFVLKWVFPAPAYLRTKYRSAGIFGIPIGYVRHWTAVVVKASVVAAYGYRLFKGGRQRL
ncbi:MAG: nucleotidyltransferase family protein [Candidatus Omnitrophica bacterium]|nr:nucleotidyltransferase family protein [Candidatus Omnitrophota bacterium]